MKKAFALLLAGLLFVPSAYAWKPFGGGYKQQVTASDIEADNTNFNGNCTGADNVQECLDLLDDAAGGGSVSDAAYGVGWNGDTTTAPSKNAVYDKIETIAAGGEVNTASNLGGGLANYSTKSGVDLQFNSFAAADFDLAANLISIDDTKWATDSGVAALYQPLDADLTYLAGFTPSANVKTILNAADYAAVRTALSLVIGTNVQAWDADLDTISGLTATTDNFIVSVASAWASRTPAQVRTTLGLVIGTNVQAWDADLDYLAGFTPSANVKTILNAADYAAVRTALSLVIGTNAQAWDADLDDLSDRSTSADWTFTTLSGKQDRNNTAVDDDDCTGEQGIWWYDTTDSQFEVCNANAGAPVAITAGGGSGDITDVFDCATGDCQSITATDGDKLDFSAVTVNTTTEGIIIPAYNSGGTATGQLSADGTNDILYFGNGTTAAAVNVFPMSSGGAGSSATRYTVVGGFLASATETDVNNYRTQRSCIMQNLHATIDTVPGGAASWTVTLRDDAAGTTLTCSITSAATECNDTTNRPTVATDSKIAVEWTRVSTAASPGNMVATFECVSN